MIFSTAYRENGDNSIAEYKDIGRIRWQYKILSTSMKKEPASKDPLRTSKQAQKPLVLGSSTLFSTGSPFSAANF